MAELVTRTPEENQNVVLAVVGAMKFSDYETRDELEFAACKRISRALPLLSEKSMPMRMLDAVRLYVEIKGIRFEQSSNRYILTFRSVNSDEDEEIRSDRIDDRNGEAVKIMFRNGDASALVGRKALVYKRNEPMPNERGRTVRVCPFIDVLD